MPVQLPEQSVDLSVTPLALNKVIFASKTAGISTFLAS
jgi:hypothetical protein